MTKTSRDRLNENGDCSMMRTPPEHVPSRASPGFSGSHFTQTLSLETICCTRSRIVHFRYSLFAGLVKGAKLVVRKCAFLKGTRFVCIFRRSASRMPGNRRHAVVPVMVVETKMINDWLRIRWNGSASERSRGRNRRKQVPTSSTS